MIFLPINLAYFTPNYLVYSGTRLTVLAKKTREKELCPTDVRAEATPLPHQLHVTNEQIDKPLATARLTFKIGDI